MVQQEASYFTNFITFLDSSNCFTQSVNYQTHFFLIYIDYNNRNCTKHNLPAYFLFTCKPVLTNTAISTFWTTNLQNSQCVILILWCECFHIFHSFDQPLLRVRPGYPSGQSLVCWIWECFGRQLSLVAEGLCNYRGHLCPTKINKC